jgi:proteasome lid subunit RPN8/RPN11
MVVKHLNVRYADWDLMRRHARELSPREACGLLAGRSKWVEKVVPVTNVAHSKYRFRMDPAEQVQTLFEFEGLGLDLLAVYHSHPLGPAVPSSTDLEEWRYPEALSLIWSRNSVEWVCKAFSHSPSGWSEVELVISNAPKIIKGKTQGARR